MNNKTTTMHQDGTEKNYYERRESDGQDDE